MSVDNIETAPTLEKNIEANSAQKIKYSISASLSGLLQQLKLSIALSSYQSGKLYLVGRNPQGGGIMIDERIFQKAMGIYVDKQSIVLATLFQIHRFENILKPEQRINHTYDACYIPRVSYTTGALDVHDVGLLADGTIIFVNTRFNCIAKLTQIDSFEPIWKPPFISKIINEDRCHLNGMAIADGTLRYVTAVSRSDTIDGWRDRRADGGIVIDVATNDIVCEGLSMPHSPRMYHGRLWLLNSGTGELGYVDPEMRVFHPVVFCPGFLRGLAFHGRYAFVGLSKPRYERFEGLALDGRLTSTDSEPWCGIQIIDLQSRTCVDWLRIDGAVNEIYDVAVIPETYCPMSLGLSSNEICSLITYDSND